MKAKLFLATATVTAFAFIHSSRVCSGRASAETKRYSYPS